MLALQWFTDSFDGKLGKLRGLGLRRWGYYMDHFLDYVFMACVMGHYAFLVPEPTRTMFLLLVPLYGAFEVNSWLEFGATGSFKITYLFLGPTEVRCVFIGVNTAIIFAGTGWLEAAMPVMLAVLVLMLCVIIYRTQRRIRAQDMVEKEAAQAPDEA
jgi:phosphatidylglycerophosphate synthase